MLTVCHLVIVMDFHVNMKFIDGYLALHLIMYPLV